MKPTPRSRCTNMVNEDQMCGDDGDIVCDDCRKDWFDYSLYEYHSGKFADNIHNDNDGLNRYDRMMIDPAYYDEQVTSNE